MRRITVLLVAGALLTAGAMTAASFASAGVTSKKTTICHRANSHKYVALTVSNQALQTHLAHHSDVIDATVVPQNNIKAARAFCAGLQILTPKHGGRKLNAKFSNTLTGVTANLDARLRPGQGQLCFNLNVIGSTVNSATITVAATAINLSPLPVSPATSSSGCVNVPRTTVKAILKDPSVAAVAVTTAAGTLNGSLAKKA